MRQALLDNSPRPVGPSGRPGILAFKGFSHDPQSVRYGTDPSTLRCACERSAVRPLRTLDSAAQQRAATSVPQVCRGRGLVGSVGTSYSTPSTVGVAQAAPAQPSVPTALGGPPGTSGAVVAGEHYSTGVCGTCHRPYCEPCGVPCECGVADEPPPARVLTCRACGEPIRLGVPGYRVRPCQGEPGPGCRP
jgi:hypothetical protein